MIDLFGMENDTTAELARLDRVERHLRRCGAFDKTVQRELALARELAWMREMKRPSDPCEPLRSRSTAPDGDTAEGSGSADAQQG